MTTTRTKIVAAAQSWLGCRESDGSFKVIIDTYNNDKPLPRGYKVRYTDEWCATFISALGIKCGAKDIILKECSCNKLIELHQANGTWVENDAYVPAPGDIIMYDWDDKKDQSTDNKNRADHVGIVEKVVGTTITIIEGNKGEAVARRTLQVNGRYIRGYIVPNYEANMTAVALDILRRGDKGEQVKTLQRLLNALGCSVGSSGIDGSFGPATEKAVIAFQKKEGLSQDGVVGSATWTSLLK